MVKISGSGPLTDMLCPGCGTELPQYQSAGIGVTPLPSDKGTMPTQSNVTSFVGFIVVLVVICFFGALAYAIKSKSMFLWLTVGLLGIVATITAGVWFQNKSKKEEP